MAENAAVFPFCDTFVETHAGDRSKWTLDMPGQDAVRLVWDAEKFRVEVDRPAGDAATIASYLQTIVARRAAADLPGLGLHPVRMLAPHDKLYTSVRWTMIAPELLEATPGMVPDGDVWDHVGWFADGQGADDFCAGFLYSANPAAFGSAEECLPMWRFGMVGMPEAMFPEAVEWDDVDRIAQLVNRVRVPAASNAMIQALTIPGDKLRSLRTHHEIRRQTRRARTALAAAGYNYGTEFLRYQGGRELRRLAEAAVAPGSPKGVGGLVILPPIAHDFAQMNVFGGEHSLEPVYGAFLFDVVGGVHEMMDFQDLLVQVDEGEFDGFTLRLSDGIRAAGLGELVVARNERSRSMIVSRAPQVVAENPLAFYLDAGATVLVRDGDEWVPAHSGRR